MNRPFALVVAIFLLLLSSLAACAPATMQREDVCRATACQQRIDRCESEHASACATCRDLWYDLLASGVTPANDCEYSCGPSHCTTACAPGEDACVERGVEFHVPAPDATLLTACRRAASRQQRCSESPIEGCDAAASVEQVSNATVYNCIANTACGGSIDSCVAALVPGTLGDELCARFTAISHTDCNPDFARQFNAWQPWLRPDAVSALRSCETSTTSDDFNACIDVWYAAATGSPSSSAR